MISWEHFSKDIERRDLARRMEEEAWEQRNTPTFSSIAEASME
jgi:hypothetical protein